MSGCYSAPEWFGGNGPYSVLAYGAHIRTASAAVVIGLGVAAVLVVAWATWRRRAVPGRPDGRLAELAREVADSREESRRKSFFLTAVSHDLRTPLNGLLLQASLAEVGAAAGDHDAVQRAAQEIKRGAKAAAELLDGLLEYARADGAADAAVSETVELSPLIGGIIAASSAAASRKGLSLRAAIPVGLAVTADHRRLDRVLDNLVTNAVKFTERGEVRVEAQLDHSAVRIHVIDTGIGIAPEHRERLFDEFFQVGNLERNRAKGFGLGLAIARRLARQMGGDVMVESVLGHGSRFTVSLPCGATCECTTAPDASPALAPHASATATSATARA